MRQNEAKALAARTLARIRRDKAATPYATVQQQNRTLSHTDATVFALCRCRDCKHFSPNPDGDLIGYCRHFDTEAAADVLFHCKGFAGSE